eukprot:1876827-Pyramimonas_sp.AAC.1
MTSTGWGGQPAYRNTKRPRWRLDAQLLRGNPRPRSRAGEEQPTPRRKDEGLDEPKRPLEALSC